VAHSGPGGSCLLAGPLQEPRFQAKAEDRRQTERRIYDDILRTGKSSKSVQCAMLKGLWRMCRHEPVIAHCTDTEDFPANVNAENRTESICVENPGERQLTYLVTYLQISMVPCSDRKRDVYGLMWKWFVISKFICLLILSVCLASAILATLCGNLNLYFWENRAVSLN